MTDPGHRLARAIQQALKNLHFVDGSKSELAACHALECERKSLMAQRLVADRKELAKAEGELVEAIKEAVK